MDDLQHLTRRVTRSMHQRLNLQVQAAIEELEEDKEFLEVSQDAQRLPLGRSASESFSENA